MNLLPFGKSPEHEPQKFVPDGGEPRRKKEFLPAIVLVICLVAFVAKAVTSMVQESATWDETSYFGLGKYLLQNQKWDVPGAILHPPLPFYLNGIPLLFFPTDQDIWKSDPAQARNLEYLGLSDIGRGQALLSSPANKGDLLLNLSRLMTVLVAALLGWYVFLWSRALYGKWSAMLAVTLYSFSPNILANARLITPDMALTAFSFIALYYLWRLLKYDRSRDMILGGIFLGFALLSKFTSVLLLPMCVALMVLWRMKYATLNTRKCFVFMAIGIVVLFLGYGTNIEPYFQGILYQQKHADDGHSGFLMGQYSSRGWWYYFIVAFLVKTPVAMIIFLVAALILFAKKISGGAWINEMFLLLPAAAIFCFFSLNPKDIGLRYVLPAYPLLFVFASSVAQFFSRRKIFASAYAAAVVWYVGASCWIHPHYLAYFNELAGGPDNGDKYLVDSNLDWGQDLKGLKVFMEKNSISRINLSYFGSDSPERYGIAYDWLPSYFLQNPSPEKNEISPKGWIAISATNLQGDYFADKNMFAWLKGRKPVAKIGYSIFIYKVDD